MLVIHPSVSQVFATISKFTPQTEISIVPILKLHRLMIASSTLIGCLLMTSAGANASEEKTAIESRFEFRGAMQLNGVWRFSLHDTASQLSFWLELEKTRRGVKPLAFDPEASLLTVQYREKSYSLPLVQAEEAPLAVATSTPRAEAQSKEKEHVLPEAPSFTPPSPPNGGRPPNSPPPEKQPEQPRF